MGGLEGDSAAGKGNNSDDERTESIDISDSHSDGSDPPLGGS